MSWTCFSLHFLNINTTKYASDNPGELQKVESGQHTGSGPQNWRNNIRARCLMSLLPVEESNTGPAFPGPTPNNRRQLG